MQTRLLLIVLSCLSFFILSPGLNQVAAMDSTLDNTLRAKIGIQIRSGERLTRATSQERLNKGDFFRIYVHPEEACFVYIIHADDTTVNLLSMTELSTENLSITLPSAEEYYQVDGASSIETITIICSPHKLPELAVMETSRMSYAEWVTIHDRLTRESRMSLSTKNKKPFSIAGNVRGISEPTTQDPFLKKLRIYSGKDMLLKNYVFRVKK